MASKTKLFKNVIINSLIFVYLSIAGFSLFNYRSHCVFTSPSTLLRLPHLDKSDSGKCRVDLDKLELIKVDIFTAPEFDFILEKNQHVKKGGVSKPVGCSALQKVAIIVPYRDRLRHLKILLNRLHAMLVKQLIEYRIFVIEQSGLDEFNRGKLMNIGYLEALKFGDFDCFVFHDADLLPENDQNLYMCDQHARHLSSAIDEMRYHVMYYNIVGGVIAINRENYQRINGYSNFYWGWGNEDDDLSARIQETGLLITRPPESIGRFKMVRHAKLSRGENSNELFFGWRGRWPEDGLNDKVGMNYTVLHLTYEPLFTNITVNIGSRPKTLPNHDSTQESLFWFLKFYYP
ncbi:hypothetical protein SNE40_022231 [Patella caerulea]|uniref:Beta-1,4-galactosyltransferase n=1 Tax=Patella caerulea TaxID=87958 RepID=A0AAN8FVZ6_PATCE